MAESSRPWTGTTIGDKGPYSAGQWQEAWQTGMGFAGQRANAGVLLGSGDTGIRGLSISQSSPVAASVRVEPGSALVQGIFYRNSVALNLTIAANASGNPRIDIVVLRIDYAAQTVRLAVKQGTAAASPVRPSLTQSVGVTWEIPLAEVAVANGFVSIANADIISLAEPANGAGAVIHDDILNNSGGELRTGDVVVWDGGTALSVTTSTDVGRMAANVAGVWQGLNANGTRGKVLSRGISLVRVNGVVAVDDPISMHSVAKEGVAAQYATFARARQAQASTGYIQCNVDVGNEYVQHSVHASCSLSANKSITNGILTKVDTWVTDYATVSNMHNNGTNPDRLVLPRIGLYMVKMYLDMANADGTYRAGFLYNSSLALIDQFRYSVAAGQGPVSFTSLFYNFTVNDYILVYVQHDGPAARNLLAGSYVRWLYLTDGFL